MWRFGMIPLPSVCFRGCYYASKRLHKIHRGALSLFTCRIQCYLVGGCRIQCHLVHRGGELFILHSMATHSSKGSARLNVVGVRVWLMAQLRCFVIRVCHDHRGARVELLWELGDFAALSSSCDVLISRLGGSREVVMWQATRVT